MNIKQIFWSTENLPALLGSTAWGGSDGSVLGNVLLFVLKTFLF